MDRQDIRWIQRLSNYDRALSKLNKIVDYIKGQSSADNSPEARESPHYILDDIIRQALIKSFEYTHELAWNVMKDYAFYQGNAAVGGSRDATREALQIHIIEDGQVWMEMIASRNKTTHTYNEAVAEEIFDKIINAYQAAFMAFRRTMREKRDGLQQKPIQ